MTVFTIGHQGLPIDSFLALLCDAADCTLCHRSLVATALHESHAAEVQHFRAA